MIRQYIKFVLDEHWSQNLNKFMEPVQDLPFNIDDEDEEVDKKREYNPFDANNEIRKVNANVHLKTQRAGFGRSSGPAGGGRRPGGNSQGFTGK